MPYKTQTAEYPDRTDMTERLRRGYLRFRPDYLPDLITFLTMVHRRFECQIQAVRRFRVGKIDAESKRRVDQLRAQQRTVSTILDAVAGKWAWSEWRDADNALAAQLVAATGDTSGWVAAASAAADEHSKGEE